MSAGAINHFKNCYNISYVCNWKYDSETKNMISDLSKKVTETKSNNVRLGITWLYEPTINYYRITKVESMSTNHFKTIEESSHGWHS